MFTRHKDRLLNDETNLDTVLWRQLDQVMTAYLSISVITSHPGVSCPGYQGLSILRAG